MKVKKNVLNGMFIKMGDFLLKLTSPPPLNLLNTFIVEELLTVQSTMSM